MSQPTPPGRPPTFDEALPTLSIRPLGVRSMFQRRLDLALRGAVGALDAFRPVVADIGVGLYLDLPDADVPVSDGQLRAWDVDLASAIDVVLRTPAPAPQFQQVESVRLFRDVRFAGSVLLRPDLVSALPVTGAPVIMVPTVGDLLLTGADDPDGLTIMARMAEKIIASGALTVSIQPLVLQGDGWVPFGWPASTHGWVGTLHRRWDGQHYAAQQPLLQEAMRRSGRDLTVAGIQLYERDGRVISVSALTEGVPTALPSVDVVNLVRDDGTVTGVGIDQLTAIPGLLEQLPDTQPPRWVVTRFPAELCR